MRRWGQWIWLNQRQSPQGRWVLLQNRPGRDPPLFWQVGVHWKQSSYEAESGPSPVMQPAFTLILEFSAPVTVKKYISAVHMLLGLWYLLQQPRRNKTASDSGSQCLTIIAMDITKQRKSVKAGSGGCFIFTGLISDIFVLGGTRRKWYLRRILNVLLHRPWNAFEKIKNHFLTENQNNT